MRWPPDYEDAGRVQGGPFADLFLVAQEVIGRMPAYRALTTAVDPDAEAIDAAVHEIALAAYRLGTVAPAVMAELGWVEPEDLLAAIVKRAHVEQVPPRRRGGMFAVSAA